MDKIPQKFPEQIVRSKNFAVVQKATKTQIELRIQIFQRKPISNDRLKAQNTDVQQFLIQRSTFKQSELFSESLLSAPHIENTRNRDFNHQASTSRLNSSALISEFNASLFNNDKCNCSSTPPNS